MKKLLNNKGSALFTVLAVMTMLTIAATATYCVVSANRKSTETHYEDEQAYQTAYSVSSAVSNYIDSYLAGVLKSNGKLSTSNPLVSKMLAMPKNEKITTTDADNKLASLKDIGMGNYDVTITKDNVKTDDDGNTTYLFKIETKAEVNDEEVRIVEYKSIMTGPTQYFTRFFTSTGNISKDVILSGQQVDTAIYLENDYSRFESSSSWLNADLFASGTVQDSNSLIYSQAKVINVTILKNFFTTGGAGGTPICAGGGTIKVGGDMTTTKPINADEIYVLGNFEISNQSIKSGATVYVNGDCKIGNGSSTEGVTFKINGKLIMESNSGAGTFYVGKGVEGTYKDYIASNVTLGGTPWSSDDVHAKSIEISNETARQTYVTWDAEQYFASAFPSAPEITPDLSGTANGLYVINESCILHPAKLQGWSNDTMIIDASLNDLYIKLVPQSGNVFKFAQGMLNVVIKGSHSVVFILPDGVSYEAQAQSYVGHVGWLQLAKDNYSATSNEEIRELAKQSTNYFQSNRTAITSRIASQLNADGVINTNIVDPLNTSTNQFMTHNNIFMVTKGSGNIDYSAQQSMFFGYTYAPYSLIKLSPSSDNRFAFLGGLITGTYEFKGDFGVAFTLPYDYYGTFSDKENYKPENYMKYLMGEATGIDFTSTTTSLQDFKTLGYE